MISLTCTDIPREGASGRFVEINTEVAEHYGIVNGSPIKIKGGKTTVAIVQCQPNLDPNIISMGSTIRINAKVREGDEVEIAAINAAPMEAAVIAPVARDLTEAEMEMLGSLNLDVYLSKLDHFISYINGEPIEFQIMKCKPSHGWLTSATNCKISSKKSRKATIEVPSISFEDIGGLDDTIEDIKEIAIVPLVHPEVYIKSGQEPPKGILLYGPPGVGKTLLAKALAREAQCKFITISGPEIISARYGDSEKAVREIFQQAKKEAPAVIYIDEIDAIAGNRKDSRGELEKRILTQLLIELDGFEDRGQVLVVGSTNMMETIDPALLRAGRFDRRIHVPYPDIHGREQILGIHSRNMPLEEINLAEWAKKTVGCSGADLANLCRHASSQAIKRTFGLQRLINPDNFTDEELSELKITEQDFECGFENFTPWATSQRRPAAIGRVEFDDVIGHQSAKNELIEHLVQPINHPEIYHSLGLSASGGILLHGPPGTGKTMLGKAAASLANVQFMAVSGPDFLSKWVGESERAVREIFQRAEELAPVVLFFDEFDAIGRARSNSESAHHSSSVVAQLLTMMDGLKSSDGIYLMASTNKPELVDEAFLRPGRFSKSIEVGPLSKELYGEFFQKSTEKVNSEISELEWADCISQMKDKATGAELQGFVDSLKRITARRCIEENTQVCLKREDLIKTFSEYRTLNSGGYQPEQIIIEENWEQEEVDDWDNDEDDDWVVP